MFYNLYRADVAWAYIADTQEDYVLLFYTRLETYIVNKIKVPV